MKQTIFFAAAPLVALLALSACASPVYVSPVEVTRFTGAAPAELGRGTIAIEPAASLDSGSLEYGMYEAELAQELTLLGYDVVAGNAGQVAVLDVEQSVSEPQRRRSPVSVGGGVGAGTYGSGVGVGVGIDLSGRQSESIRTEVAVFIRPSAGGGNLWEGRADFTATANSDFADPALAADRAISALFEGFPGQSGETVIVE